MTTVDPNAQPSTRLTTSSGNGAGAWPRYLNAAIGAWLFISAFVWPHTGAELTNAWIVGALMFIAALLALGAPAVRFVNTVLAVWLLISTLAIGANTATLWNHIIIAIVAFVVSFIPSQMTTPTPHRTAHGAV